jgi:DNA-binding winged helix-turn-helix (wHTH) protein/TolB-like protein
MNTSSGSLGFGGFTLEPAQRRLRSPDGRVVPLSVRAYDVLAYLVQHGGRVVSKDELIRAVWPTTVVEENNLNQAISTLRRALGDPRESPRYILTVPGRGYQFIASVQEQPAAANAEIPVADEASMPEAGVPLPDGETRSAAIDDPGSARRESRPSRRQVAAGLLAVAAVGSTVAWLWRHRSRTTSWPRSIAVLPFRPLVETAADEAVEVGIAESLINRMSELPGVVVLPLSSVRRYRSLEQDPIVAGRELGVDAVVDGYVQVQADQVRLTVRLLDVADGTSLWAGRFNERLVDFFRLQDSLASQLVDALAIPLTGAARERLLHRETSDVAAWQFYVNARYQLDRRTEAGLRRSIEYFEAAERSDPKFALAAAGLAETWSLLAVFNAETPRVAFGRARAAAERALALEETLAEASAALGHVHVQYDYAWDEGRRLYDRALALKPSFTQGLAWRALLSMMRGRFTDANRDIANARAIEPMSLAFASIEGLAHYFERDFDAARQHLSPIVATAPDANLPRGFLAMTEIEAGHPEAALRLIDGRDGRYPGGLGLAGRAHARLGNRDRVELELARLEELGSRGFGVGYDIALIEAARGNRDVALAALERGIDDHSQMLGHVNSDPGFDPIRRDSRFGAVLRRLRLP